MPFRSSKWDRLNPSEATFKRVPELLAEAYDLARRGIFFAPPEPGFLR
jgi:hypothetical protein